MGKNLEDNEALRNYNDFVQKNGKIRRNAINGCYDDVMLEDKIAEKVILLREHSKSLNPNFLTFLGASRQIVHNMLEMAECVTERYFKGSYFELSPAMVDLLINDFRCSLKKLSDGEVSHSFVPNVIDGEAFNLEYRPKAKSFTYYVNGEAILGIRTFEDDRFMNEAMVSCDHARYHGFNKSARVVSKNYIFGENGIFVNAQAKSFLEVFRNNGEEDFPFGQDLKYYYFPYASYANGEEGYSYIDRKNGIKKTFSNGEEKVYTFKSMLLDCAFVGGPLQNDEEMLESIFVCTEASTDKAKQYVKKDDKK